MITIVIADDEKLIRAGIRKILTDALGNELNIIEAKNGAEALELCKTELPYLLITDIRMPVMDGVELMENVSAMEQKPAIIVLSGFEDFSYAKSAISAGAMEYLLKPVDAKDLMRAVNLALSAAQKANKNKSEQILKTVLSEGHLDENLEFDIKDFPDGFCSVCFSGKFKDEVSNLLAPKKHFIIESKKEMTTVLVSKTDVPLIAEDRNFSKSVVGISQSFTNIIDLRKMLKQSFSAFLQSYFVTASFKKTNGVYFYSENNAVYDFGELDTRYEKMTAALDLMSTDEIKKTWNALFDFENFESDKRAEVLFYIYDKINNNLSRRYPKFNENDTYLYLKSLMIENIDQVDNLNDWKRYVLEYVFYLSELLKKTQGKYPYITKAITYINKHYAENITMATVANYVSMNYTWFSEKFKEQVGVNFNDYLKKFRMEQAKHLLEMGTYKVYEVAEKCGFKDVKHFMKSFREMNGMSAGEWAKLHS